MPSSTLTLILAGGEGERLSILSQVRAKPGVPFGGKYRIIDFALSNAVNSGLTDVGILTQYAPRSPHRPHRRRPARGTSTAAAAASPCSSRSSAAGGRATGTAAPPTQCSRTWTSSHDRDPELVLVLAGDHVYKMDYRPFIELPPLDERGGHVRGAHGAHRGGPSVRHP